LTWLALALAQIPGNALAQAATAAAAPTRTPPDLWNTFVYECAAGESFSVKLDEGVAWVFAPGKTLRLARVQAASGSKYQEGDAAYWSEGAEATLDIGAMQWRGCHNNRMRAVWEAAKLRGVDFRAIGNEPAWYLEISQAVDVLFVTDYGAQRHALSAEPPTVDIANQRSRYLAKSDQITLEITIDVQPCSDSMSGELFSSVVTVKRDDTYYRGCGRALH
jgi:putative lipoprotein